MKSDFDRLMAERVLDGLIVTGPSHANPAMYYMINGAHVGEATTVIKKRDEAPVIFANSMERDEAAKSGLRVVDRSQYDPLKILNEEKGDRLRARARLTAMMLDELGVKGRVAVYGREEQGEAFALWHQLMALRNDIQIVGEYGDTVFNRAYYTKDADEVARIRAVGEKTMIVVGNTWDFLASHRAADGVLVKDDGTPLTVGDVKREIRGWIREQELEAPEDFIFAIGRDAGVPHSRGEDSSPIALGQTIVYDIFPREAGSGYYFDFTRTWCVGFAPPDVEKAFREVLEIFNITSDAMHPGTPCANYQKMTNDYFEARGHPTMRTNPQTTEGYVHSLGHGVGLNIHEGPSLSEYEGNTDILEPGVAITVEPGLYYPDKGFGVRIEDFLWLNPKTLTLETIGEFPKDLVIPLKKAGGRRSSLRSGAGEKKKGTGGKGRGTKKREKK
ncbi:MAG: M24 family metallopeptidase [Chloroflexi bacterium]|nr:M24 family metallopeptidase [Chloroflexota bacterium]